MGAEVALLVRSENREAKRLGLECSTFIREVDVLHALLGCSLLEGVWRDSGLPFVGEMDINLTFVEWFVCALNLWSSEQASLAVILCYNLWTRRNESRLEIRSWPLDRILQRSKEMWSDISNLKLEHQLQLPSTSPPSRWLPPPLNFYKINTDASRVSETGAGAGCVIRNWSGRVLAASVLKIPSSKAIELLEAEAVKRGMEMAIRLGIQKAMVEGECLGIMNFLQSNVSILSPLGTVLNNIKSLVQAFSFVSFKWIPRDANQVANKLAQLGSRASTLHISMF
ncbi:uncharacterized protein G2W53_016511 [Senna tora]|uniref:RNase H type-1 domain-containing protein n=1 Tax=Senna tora TaxID=362788 RepID=A0A834TPD3_9FABA|nr:uncharacterized protein G2W53_016511 [Senna tora]